MTSSRFLICTIALVLAVAAAQCTCARQLRESGDALQRRKPPFTLAPCDRICMVAGIGDGDDITSVNPNAGGNVHWERKAASEASAAVSNSQNIDVVLCGDNVANQKECNDLGCVWWISPGGNCWKLAQGI